MNNLGQGVQGLPQVSTTNNNDVLGQGVESMPMIEGFGRRRHGGHHGGRHGGHHGLRPGMRGLRGYWPGYYGYAAYPSYSYVQTPSCGGSNCNQYWSNTDKKFESAPNTQCTCCSTGKSCRLQKNAPSGIQYSDCCSGMSCKGEGVQGVCMNE